VPYAAILELRQVVGITILALPIGLMAWGWIRLFLRRPTDPPLMSWWPSAGLLLLMTVSYGLTLAQIFSPVVEHYFFNLWHTSDMAAYLLISFLACVFAWVGKSPIRWPVFCTGLLLTVLYFAVGWSLMD
jgi:hypothetical protein